MKQSTAKFDLFLFGSNSEIFQKLLEDHEDYFRENVNTFHLIQRHDIIPEFSKSLRIKHWILRIVQMLRLLKSTKGYHLKIRIKK